MTPGGLLITIEDRRIEITMIGGGSWSIPVGPSTLVERELEHSDRPAPEQLTNALGIVTDHLEDVIRESPMMLDAANVTICGRHANGLACVEIGAETVPAGYTLSRADADEVFRTLVAEPADQRRHNPGLDPGDVESIIGTCCVVLSVMRRFDLPQVAVISELATGVVSDRVDSQTGPVGD